MFRAHGYFLLRTIHSVCAAAAGRTPATANPPPIRR